MLKTIFVVYSEKTLKEQSLKNHKRYCFNTDYDVNVGDTIKSPKYDTKMQVVMVLDKKYKYYNSETGELKSRITSTKQQEIRELKILDVENSDNIVHGFIVKNQ